MYQFEYQLFWLCNVYLFLVYESLAVWGYFPLENPSRTVVFRKPTTIFKLELNNQIIKPHK